MSEPRGAELGISDVYLYGLWSLMGTVVAKGPHVGRASRMSTLLSRALSHVTPQEKQVLKCLALEASQRTVLLGIQSVTL